MTIDDAASLSSRLTATTRYIQCNEKEEEEGIEEGTEWKETFKLEIETKKKKKPSFKRLQALSFIQLQRLLVTRQRQR